MFDSLLIIIQVAFALLQPVIAVVGILIVGAFLLGACIIIITGFFSFFQLIANRLHATTLTLGQLTAFAIRLVHWIIEITAWGAVIYSIIELFYTQLLYRVNRTDLIFLPNGTSPWHLIAVIFLFMAISTGMALARNHRVQALYYNPLLTLLKKMPGFDET
jgi:hypothetical protein